MVFQPLYKGGSTSSSSLIIGDPEGHTGIITLWSKAKEIAAKIDKSNYAVIGQLFSAERGLDILIRNLLANPQITNLVVTGVDFSKSGIVLMDFFEKGFEKGKVDATDKPCWRVKSQYPGYIGLDIPEEALNTIRETIGIIKAHDITKLDFSSLERPEKKRGKIVVMKQEETTKKYVGEYAGHIVRGKTIAEAWLKVLDTILKFGKVSGTHFDDKQKEVMNLLSIISEEDPNNFNIPDYLPGDRQHIQEYIPRITADLPGGIHKNEYTYGSRIRSWFGTDQVKNAVAKLVKEPISRAVVISLWDQTKDLVIGGSPCLNHIWFRIVDDKLHMTAIFRSHDMFEGYPENCFGLRALQEEVRKDVTKSLEEKGTPVDLKPGNLCILSQSAHIYDDCWEHCEKLLEKYYRPFIHHLSELDPRGNFVVSIEGDDIILEHTTPTNITLGVYRAKSAAEMRNILAKENIVSLIPHALDLGLELMKAETAIKLKIHYNQDQPLKFAEIANVRTSVE